MSSDLLQFAALACSAISAGVISPFLVLKRMTMFANSLSHTSLLGVGVAYVLGSVLFSFSFFDLGALLMGAFISALLTALLTEGARRFFRLNEDASIGLIFITLFALGVTLVTLFTKNTHLSVEAVLGNPDALQMSDLLFAFPVALLNLSCIALFYRPLQLVAFDEPFAKAIGVKATLWRICLIFLTALSCISAFRAVGALVVLTMLTAPYLTVRFFSSKLLNLIILTPLLGVIEAGLAVLLSRFLFEQGLALSTAGLFATLSGLIFGLGACLRRFYIYFKTV